MSTHDDWMFQAERTIGRLAGAVATQIRGATPDRPTAEEQLQIALNELQNLSQLTARYRQEKGG